MTIADMSKYKRILLKISGEVLMGPLDHGLDNDTMERIASEVKEVHEKGFEICLVVGGGNIYRGVNGAKNHGIDRATSDYIGMLATVMNALALQSILEGMGVDTRVISAIKMNTICEPYIRRRAMSHMSKGYVVIFAGGSGSPFFTTDTAAALRASEMKCDLLLKGTKVDGVYSADPFKDKSAIHYGTLTYRKVLTDKLNVMDMPAIALASENKLPVAVFQITDPGCLMKTLKGESKFTLIDGE